MVLDNALVSGAQSKTTTKSILQDTSGVLKWTQCKCTGDVPQKRSGHTLTVVGQNAYMLCGLPQARVIGPSNEVFRLQLPSAGHGDYRWVKLSGDAAPTSKATPRRPESKGGHTSRSSHTASAGVRKPGPPQPLGRWKHSATLFGGTKIAVFGGFHATHSRLCDMWIYDTQKAAWSNAWPMLYSFDENGNHEPIESGSELLNDCPTPRGGHSACLVGDSEIWIIGGYGGTKFARKEYNDVYKFDTKTFQFSKVNVKGKAPDPRSGHSAVAFGDEILLYGGWNSHCQFSDLWSLDTKTETWTCISQEHANPRWSHCAVAIPAIPYSKMLVFGGSVGGSGPRARVQGAYSADLLLLDNIGSKNLPEGAHLDDAVTATGANTIVASGSRAFEQARWLNVSDLNFEGAAPAPRADFATAYDGRSARLFISGGWANRWYGDLYALNMQQLIGPPYAITGLEPSLGPVTGNIPIRIQGQGFVSSEDITVRFIAKNFRTGEFDDGSPFEDVHGTFVNSTEISCDIPSFEKHSPGAVQVRISIGGDAFTTTFQPFRFFSVTDASKSLAFGPALLNGNIAMSPTSFVIQARDMRGQDRSNGGDEFAVEVVKLQETGEESFACPSLEQSSDKILSDYGLFDTPPVDTDKVFGPSVQAFLGEDDDQLRSAKMKERELKGDRVDIAIRDEDDGTYTVSFVPPSSGDYIIRVRFVGTYGGEAGAVLGSPFHVRCYKNDSSEVQPLWLALRVDEASPGSSSSSQSGKITPQMIRNAEKESPESMASDINDLAGSLLAAVVRFDIREINAFLKSSLTGIKEDVRDSDLNGLLRVKEHILAISKNESQLEYAFERAKAVLNYREDLFAGQRKTSKLINTGKIAAGKADTGLGRTFENGLRRLTETWQTVKRQVPITRGSIQPLVKAHGTALRQDMSQYEGRVEHYASSIHTKPFMYWDTGIAESRAALWEAREKHETMWKELKEKYHTACVFDFPEVMRKMLQSMRNVDLTMDAASDLWDLAEKAESFFANSKQTLWAEVEADSLEEEAKSLLKDVNSTLSSRVKTSGAYKGLLKSVREYLSAMPLVLALHHPSMRMRHWNALQKVTGKSFTPPPEDPELRLEGLLALQLHRFQVDVEEITDQAMKESQMEVTLEKLDKTWADINWVIEEVELAGGKPIETVKLGEEDVETLENDQLAVQTMVGSRYRATFEADVLSWHKKLSNVADVVALLAEVTRSWTYLEPLFLHSDEVKKELPEDAERFQHIDQTVRSLLHNAVASRNVVETCNAPGVLSSLEDMCAQLDQCRKSLLTFLDQKRRLFPRFYFVSEADLLDILSNGANPQAIMKHISKVLLATSNLRLQKPSEHGRPNATHFVAGVGKEVLPFRGTDLQLTGKAEEYLLKTLQHQQHTIKDYLLQSYKRYDQMPRDDWVVDFNAETNVSAALSPEEQSIVPVDPAQIVVLVASIKYVEEVELALKAASSKNALLEFQKKQRGQLASLIRLTRKSLSKGARARVMVNITMDSHSRDVVQRLIDEDVTSIEAFQWQSQLKHRITADGACVANILNAKFDYGNEYLGNGPRLVITPLTDRIYVTATQALNLNMGCAPAGPAGTGKTETTKDLASALGIVCYVFNCSPEMDYRTLGNIFKGLAASGAWGCFDEFNRLVPEVLSVCSVQFKAVCDGIRSRESTVTVEGDTVSLKMSAGAFITMNPGYLGRSELPEGLKALFRPITVMVPDLVLICENMLMAEGFEGAKVLARKFYGLYALLRELLSKQSHYDWGLRAVKSVLVVAGGFKRAEPDLPEEHLLMRALRDFNVPKIVQQDEVVFYGLLGDLFPSVDPPRKRDQDLEDAVVAAAKTSKLEPSEDFCLKVVQLKEVLDVRHCVFVMGPPGSGKSKTWRTLVEAQNIIHESDRTVAVDLNPKAVEPEELYGYVHPATREWKDGLLSKTMRDLGQDQSLSPKWIILDGDLDANWIESMNSVMDDNKMLTLANNERIPLKQHMRMLFEIRDLQFASPATVSRAGIIYISTETGFQWRNLIASWLEHGPGSKLPKAVTATLEKLFDEYVEPALLYHKKTLQPLVPVQDTTLVSTLLEFLSFVIPSAETAAQLVASKEEDQTESGNKAPNGGDKTTVEDGKYFQTYGALADVVHTCDLSQSSAALEGSGQAELEAVFAFAAVWAFGSVCAEKDGIDWKRNFSDFWRGTFKGLRFPSRDTVFDYYLDPSGHLQPWKSHPSFTAVTFDSANQEMNQIFVPTPETVSINFWARLLMQSRLPVMLAGYAGCGKTAVIQGLLDSLGTDTVARASINFNFFTDSKSLQNTMEGALEKKAGTTFGPPPGKDSLVFFVDDINLPEVDPYSTQSAIALLRQHIDYAHWYDRNKLFTKHVVDCQYVACMNPTAGSFQINPRLQRHFTTFAVGFPGALSLLTIYQTFLDGHLRRFSDEISALSSQLLNSALALHHAVASSFRKSAMNFHYEFNVRHLSSVFQGILAAEPSQFTDPVKLIRLWLHESERVYSDRLVSAGDVEKFRQLALTQVKKRFPQFSGLATHFASENPEPLIFCHFAEGLHEKVYDQSTSLDHLTSIVTQALQDHNENFTTMDLVLFSDAVRHVCRISRVLLAPGGHALLVGVGGSGKQSLARLAAFICDTTLFSIRVSATYGENDFKDDLRNIYYKTGVKGEQIMFLLRDSQIINERFLVFLNDVLASGNVPDLYNKEDQDSIINDSTNKAKAAGFLTDRESVWSWYMQQVRRNLHVVLCFSPGETLRIRALRFPAIVNCTTIDWFHPWPQDALLSVSTRFISRIEEMSDPVIREGVIQFMPHALLSVNELAGSYRDVEGRYAYTTPKSFLEGLQTFQTLLHRQRTECEQQITRLSNGVEKLRQTGTAVEQIEADLKVSLDQAEEKKNKAEGIAAQVSEERARVAHETSAAEQEERTCAELQNEVEAKRHQCEHDLQAAEPLLENAQKALDTLNKKELGECRGMIRPPQGVDDIFVAIMILMAGVNPDVPISKSGKVKPEHRDWDNAKKSLLRDTQVFLDQLRDFKQAIDDFKVPEINMKEVRPYLELEHFSPEAIGSKNKMAAGLCSWVLNIIEYYDVLMMVTPKREALKEANSKLESANKRLQTVREQVAELQRKLDELTAELDEAEAEKARAQAEVDNGQKRLNLAQRLLRALGDEEERWCTGIEKLQADQKTLVGDVLLASAFVSYAGPFSSSYRRTLVEDWWLPFIQTAAAGESLPLAEDPSPLRVLTSDAEIAAWQGQGLPADQLSTENGAIVKSSSRWPLLLDPQLQGIGWLRRYESEDMFVTRIDRPDLVQRLSECVEQGKSVLLENLGESLDPMLWPLITRSTVKKGRKRMVVLAGRELDFSPNFKLYLHTKLSNPHYPPEVQAECTLINFTVTQQGLEEQLLSLTVSKERQDLSEQRTELIKQQNYFKVKMKELEDDILQRLAEAEGDVTENVELIESLENAKELSVDIQQKMKVADATRQEITITSEKYRSVASRAALLFFMLMSLDKIHTYYVHSLQSFVNVVIRAIDSVSQPAESHAVAAESEDKSAQPSNTDTLGESSSTAGNTTAPEQSKVMSARAALSDEDLKDRCDLLSETITLTVYKYVRRGLFDKDKLMVATLLTLKILTSSGQLPSTAAAALVRGEAQLDAESRGVLSEWMSFSTWSRCRALQLLSGTYARFSSLGQDMQLDSDLWQAWYDSETPENEKLPGPQRSCGTFEKLLLLRAMRPDRLPAALRTFVAQKLGNSYVEEEPLNMRQVYTESDKTSPIFFVLFPGVDPTAWVEELGARVGISLEKGNLMNISMGQGQEERAEKALKQFCQEGGWLMLQNVHLMQSWLPRLERLLEVETVEAHENFRCFISAEPPPLSYLKNMPESLMQGCIKIANEAATDVRSNMTRAIASFDPDNADNCSKSHSFKSCLFGLCFFHAVLLGRRRFGFQGWSKRYSFNQGDLTICGNVLQDYLERAGGADSANTVPWQDLRYIFGEIMYGGHITDAWDRRTNNTYLSSHFTSNLLNAADLAPECASIVVDEYAEDPADREKHVPGFVVPDFRNMSWTDANAYVSENLPEEQPQIYGLHPNSEINWLQSTTDGLFEDILRLEGADPFASVAESASQETKSKSKKKSGDQANQKGSSLVRRVLDDLLERLPEEFSLIDLQMRAEPLLTTDNSPFVVVALQECSRMNALLREIRRSLLELCKGLDGQLNMTDAMEDLTEALSINQVPGRNPFHRASWEKLAWPSRRSLSSWFSDLIDRVNQLSSWSETLQLPYSLWLPGLFNPTAFLTAVMQVTARQNSYPLDSMTTDFHATFMQNPDEIESYPHNGAYVHGLYLEGARFTVSDEDGKRIQPYIIENVECGGCISDAILKQLLPPMPVMYVNAVRVQPDWEPSSVGYLRHNPKVYEAPVYYTTARGPTYVTLATLRTFQAASKWVLAGVSLILQSDE